MKLTPEEMKKLPPGIYVTNKCDHCGKIMKGFLTYRGTGNQKEYCSRACFEAGESNQGKATTMIQKTKKEEKAASSKPEAPSKNKQAIPAVQEMKKAKGVVSKMEEDLTKSLDPKKGKKGEPEEKPEPKAKKPEPKPEPKAKKAEKEPEEKPAKAKKAEKPEKPAKAGKAKKAEKTTPYREGSAFAHGFARLAASSKPMTLDQMFEGCEAGDPSRMVSHMIRRGDETGEFKISRTEDGKVAMTKPYSPK